jgi:hypothetical protein
MSNTKMTEEELTRAKKDYMNYVPVAEIARKLNHKRETVQYHVNEKWRSERTLRKNTLSAEFADAKGALMNHTFSSSFKGIKAWVDTVTQPGYPMKPHEAKTLMSIIESMDKIMRLDQGSPTDIISETRPVSVVEIRKQILASDPFAPKQIEDTSFKEIEDENTESDT